MNVDMVNALIYNTMFNDSAAIAKIGGYIVDGHYCNLFNTDTLNNGAGNPSTPDYTEMMYTLDGCKNYVFVGIRGLNVIASSNISVADLAVTTENINTTEAATAEAVNPEVVTAEAVNTNEVINTTEAVNSEAVNTKSAIVLYSATRFNSIKDSVETFERFTFFKNMYEEVSANVVIYEEFFIKMEQYFQSEKNKLLVSRMKAIMDNTDEDLFLTTNFSEKFKIPRNILKFIINLIKMAYSEYYVENKPYRSYIDHVYGYILKLTVEEYVLLYGDRAQYIADICYKEFLNLQEDITKIGETCEFILYFIGKYKQLTKQTCGSLIGTYFGKVFKNSPIHIAKKRQIIDLTNRIKLEQAKIKTKKKENEGLKKIQMLKNLINTIEEEIIYIKELYKLQFFTIIHAFIEYPLMVTYFKRKINTSDNNLLYILHLELTKCTKENYIQLFPSLMVHFDVLTKEEIDVGCSFILDVIYPDKKLEDIEISPKRGTIIENIIYTLYGIEKFDDKEINNAKLIAFILYISIYFYM